SDRRVHLLFRCRQLARSVADDRRFVDPDLCRVADRCGNRLSVRRYGESRTGGSCSRGQGFRRSSARAIVMPVLLVYGVAYSIDRLAGKGGHRGFARYGITVRWRSMSTANTALEGTLSNSLSGEQRSTPLCTKACTSASVRSSRIMYDIASRRTWRSPRYQHGLGRQLSVSTPPH